MDAEFDRELRQDFLVEAGELLQRLGEQLVGLEVDAEGQRAAERRVPRLPHGQGRCRIPRAGADGGVVPSRRGPAQRGPQRQHRAGCRAHGCAAGNTRPAQRHDGGGRRRCAAGDAAGGLAAIAVAAGRAGGGGHAGGHAAGGGRRSHRRQRVRGPAGQHVRHRRARHRRTGGAGHAGGALRRSPTTNSRPCWTRCTARAASPER